MSTARVMYACCVHALSALTQLLAHHKSIMDAARTLHGNVVRNCRDTLKTLCARCNWQI